MNIGIVVYSQTGNTLSVAQRLQKALEEAGHAVSLEQVTSADGKPTVAGPVALLNAPKTEGCDALVLAAPVWAFGLCSVMKAYLAGLPPLRGKKVSCFVTQAFAYPWMGGNRAVRQLSGACTAKEGDVIHTAVICWGSKDREAQIARLAGTRAGF
jgi:multimeric flavodoxin WrbA